MLTGNVKFTDGKVSNEFPPYYGVGKIELNYILPIPQFPPSKYML